MKFVLVLESETKKGS